jgi:hypothetical protein
VTTETGIKMRVRVEDAWDTATFLATPDWTVARVKAEALRLATRTEPDPDSFEIKLRGAAVLDEARTLGQLSVRDLAPFVVLSVRRRPVR